MDQTNAYDQVDDEDQKVISVRWVISQRFKDSKTIYKACLIARWFEEDNLNCVRKDSPTSCKDNLCSVFNIIAFTKWIIHSVDVKSTFTMKRDQSWCLFKDAKEAGITMEIKYNNFRSVWCTKNNAK